AVLQTSFLCPRDAREKNKNATQTPLALFARSAVSLWSSSTGERVCELGRVLTSRPPTLDNQWWLRFSMAIPMNQSSWRGHQIEKPLDKELWSWRPKRN